MKRIGIYSGTFDPLTNGHLWIIEEGKKLFDEFHVLIGTHPKKECYFSVEERKEMVDAVVKPPIKVDILYDQNIIEYVSKLDGDISLLRGIREEKDTQYELDIVNCIRAAGGNYHFIFLPPPESGKNISSSHIKYLVACEFWAEVEKMVPSHVLAKLKVKKPKWLALEPEVASIFGTSTVGFVPITDETSRGINLFSNNSHKIEMVDELEDLIKSIGKDKVNIQFYGRMRDNFAKLVKHGILQFANFLSCHQVREMLDPCSFDVVVSDTFYLKTIPLLAAEPLGERYLPCSQSLGPIIVETNTVIGNNTSLGYLGPIIVIEGKHRWLDAEERGDKYIMAYVGSKALKDLEINEC